jgi:hypothetical protein
MQLWILLGILILAEIFVFARLPLALFRGAVPLNPLGWFGYGELAEVYVDRENSPTAYWLIVLILVLMAVILGCFIYLLWSGGAGPRPAP